MVFYFLAERAVVVEGFTDNVPINTEVFPSNWELSAGRAASVVHVFTRNGVRPERLVAMIDFNGFQLDGSSDEIMPLAPLFEKFHAFQWNVAPTVFNGHDVASVLQAFAWENLREKERDPIATFRERGRRTEQQTNVMKTSKTSRAAPPRRRVFIVDDHPITRYGLTQLLNREPLNLFFRRIE